MSKKWLEIVVKWSNKRGTLYFCQNIAFNFQLSSYYSLGGFFDFWGCASSSQVALKFTIDALLTHALYQSVFLFEHCGYGMLETVWKRQFFIPAWPCSLFLGLYYNSSWWEPLSISTGLRCCLWTACKWNLCLVVVVVWKPLSNPRDFWAALKTESLFSLVHKATHFIFQSESG